MRGKLCKLCTFNVVQIFYERFSSELPDHCYISRQALHCVHTSPAMVHHSADSSWHSPQNSPLINTIYKRKIIQIVSVNNSTITWVL